MKLSFEGQAVVENDSGGVKFVGRYSGPDGRERYVICRVERRALEIEGLLNDPAANDLLAAYRALGNDIHRVAAAQFAGGIERPIVTLFDLKRVEPDQHKF